MSREEGVTVHFLLVIDYVILGETQYFLFYRNEASPKHHHAQQAAANGPTAGLTAYDTMAV